MSDDSSENEKPAGDKLIAGSTNTLGRMLGVLVAGMGGVVTVPKAMIDAMDGIAVVVLEDKETGSYAAMIMPNDQAMALYERKKGDADLPPITPTLVDKSKLN